MSKYEEMNVRHGGGERRRRRKIRKKVNRRERCDIKIGFWAMGWESISLDCGGGLRAKLQRLPFVFRKRKRKCTCTSTNMNMRSTNPSII